MKNTLKILSIFAIQLVFAQNNFKIELSAPSFVKDSLYIGAAANAGQKNIYNFSVIPDKQVVVLGKFSSVIVRIREIPSIIQGKIDYPQLVNISYYDPKINGGYVTKPFILEKGNFNISVNRQNNLDYVLKTSSPANAEFQKLEEELAVFNTKLKPYAENYEKDLRTKQAFLKTYIKQNPDSFAAFWEIVYDFARYNFDKSYIGNLALFSDRVKKTYSFIEFEKIMKIENSTNVGGNFPDLIFENQERISKSDFQKYDLTLIDYWSTTCRPCIQDMPKLVALHENLKGKNVNFISVTAENQKSRMAVAEKILRENNVGWKNYFDTKGEFPKKLNAAGFPLQIIVDRNGKIIGRKLGQLDEIEQLIKNYLK